MATPEKDYLTQSGATDLAAIIHKHWAEKGHLVHVRVEKQQATLNQSSRADIWVIRSNLVSGLPPRAGSEISVPNRVSEEVLGEPLGTAAEPTIEKVQQLVEDITN
jgi:hypothetical protein